MALPNYPSSPVLGEQYTVGTLVFQWDGEKWKALSNADQSLRSQLAATDSDTLVGGVKAGDIADARNLFVYPEQFGAVGDGVADDTAAIQAAIDTGKKVKLQRNKTYEITDSLIYKTNTWIEGEAPNTEIRLRSGLSKNMFTPDFSATGYTENVVFKNFTIDQQILLAGDFVESVMTFIIYRTKKVLFDSVKLKNPSGDGIYISRTYGGSSTTDLCEDVVIQGCSFTGTRKNRNGISVIAGSRIRIKNNTFIGMTRVDMPGAIDLEPNSPAEDVIFDVIISGNHIYACKGGIVLYSVDKTQKKISDVTITKNTISSCRGAETSSPIDITINSTPAIWVGDAKNVTVDGNTVLGDSLGGANGVTVDYTENVIISNNVMEVNEVGAVLARSERLAFVDNIIKLRNDTYKTRTCYGVWAGVNSTEISDSNISGNVVVGVAGATSSIAYTIETGLVDSKLHSGPISGFNFGLALGRSLWSNVDLNMNVDNTTAGATFYGKADAAVSSVGDWTIGEGYTQGSASFSASTTRTVASTAAYIGSVVQVINTTAGSSNQISAECTTNGSITFTGSESSSDTFFWKIVKV